MDRQPDTKSQPTEDVNTLRRQIQALRDREEAWKQRLNDLDRNKEIFRTMVENAGDCIWTVDMNLKPIYVSPTISHLLGYTAREAMDLDMADIFTPRSFQMIVRAFQQERSKPKSAEEKPTKQRNLLVRMRRKDGQIAHVDITFSWNNRENEDASEILAVARDATKRIETESKLRDHAERMNQAMEGMISALSMVVEIRDPYTAGHQRRVSEISCSIAAEMGIATTKTVGLRLAALVHDIGKVRIPTEILINPDPLTEAEFSMIRRHPITGYEILNTVEFPWPIAEIVHQHHERINGSGYPQGLKGNEIRIEARILAVADVMDAMTSHRPYRPALGKTKALREILINRGILFDADVVDACGRL